MKQVIQVVFTEQDTGKIIEIYYVEVVSDLDSERARADATEEFKADGHDIKNARVICMNPKKLLQVC